MNTRIVKLTMLTAFVMLLLACAGAEKPKTAPPEATPAPTVEAVETGISYARNIQPIMVQSCTPCHYPEKGKKELLDTYDATARYIDDIIYRIQLPPDSVAFMPFKSKKMPLTTDEIQLFIDWRDAGLPD